MTTKNGGADARYEALTSPLRSAGRFTEANQEALLKEESEVLDGTTFKRRGSIPPRRGMQIIKAGDLMIVAGKTTPVFCSNSSAHFSCFMAMPYIGGFTTRDGQFYDEVRPGEIYLNQRYYGTSTIGYLSSLFFALDRKRLGRTMRTISGGESLASISPSVIIKNSRQQCGMTGSRKLWSLISLIDQLHGENTSIPACLGLDEQFYRLLSLTLLEAVGRFEKVQKHWAAAVKTWRNPFDDLVDYIRANAHLALTLTDLEAQSHYSARHLQAMFKEKLGVTPMQFVRRQKLSRAMEKLQTADWDDTVTTIARDCGYRFTSNFSTDFQREFGVKPSTVLRSSRKEEGGGAWCISKGQSRTNPPVLGRPELSSSV